VCNDEDALSAVGRTDIGSANARPRRVIPERGQVSQDLGKRSSSVDSKETWDVLHEDVSGSQLANDTGELGPEPARVALALAAASGGDRLAGEASNDEVNASVSVTPS
jgi:hypothetical protein